MDKQKELDILTKCISNSDESKKTAIERIHLIVKGDSTEFPIRLFLPLDKLFISGKEITEIRIEDDIPENDKVITFNRIYNTLDSIGIDELIKIWSYLIDEVL